MAQDNRPAPNAHTEPLKTTYATEKVSMRFSRGMVVATCIEHVGFRGDDAMRLMLQVAYAESGWIFNRVSSTGDYGLFQINKKAWGPLFQQYDWQNPLDNARMARHVYEKQGIKAWAAYNNGSYKKALGQAEQALREYKMLSQDHRLAILDAYKSGTPLTRAAQFGTTVATTVPIGLAREGAKSAASSVTDSISGAMSSVTGALGAQLGGIANNALGIVIAVVLLILGVFVLLRGRR